MDPRIAPVLHPSPRPRTRRARVAAVAGALLVATLAACSSSGNASSSSVGAASQAGGSSVGGDQKAPPASGSAASKPGSEAVTQVVAAERKITRTASLSIQVKDVAGAANAVHAIVAGLDGFVLNEQLGKDGGPQPLTGAAPSQAFNGFGTITVSVPADKLDTTLDQLARVGTVLSRSTTSQDVTDQYVDTASRVKTMQASLDRVRALLAQATNIGQVVALESELSRREADLESLQAQLAALKGSVDRSTVTIALSTPAVVAASVDNTGFLAGLRQGWHAFQTSVTAVLTVVGALLPFAALVGLVGWPLWRWLRRRQAGVTASPAPAAPGAP
ncbi:MAG TPA: DUF4349 domain-containing protein [Oryzihumus sp.]|nr:DUF4349 domain-containing protein [Oryzihumus sp.]